MDRRSHLPEGVKTKKWEERMEKTKKEQAIKKLQSELKQEKVDDLKRYPPLPVSSSPCPTQSDVPAPLAAARSPRSGKRPLKSGNGSRRRRRRFAPKHALSVATRSLTFAASPLDGRTPCCQAAPQDGPYQENQPLTVRVGTRLACPVPPGQKISQAVTPSAP